MLKIVEKLKAQKTWCLTTGADGFYIVDYMPQCGPYAAEQADIDEAREKLAREFPNGAPPSPGEHPGWNAGSAEARKEWDVKSNKERHFNNLTDRSRQKVLPYHPVFEGALSFKDHSRGRSKVTMNFVTDDGQSVPFGATGISSLMENIANGNIRIKGGKFHVRFTFEKKGANVYAYPYYPEKK